jgi:hypothetical protein
MQFHVNFDFIFLFQLLNVVKDLLDAEGSFVDNLGQINVNKECANDVAIKSVCKTSMSWD